MYYGKKIKINDFNFQFGKSEEFIKAYFCFKSEKNSIQYLVFSNELEPDKLYFGSVHIGKDRIVVMDSKEGSEYVKEMINKIVNKEDIDSKVIIDISSINKVEIISKSNIEIDKDTISKLDSITIEKEKVVEVEETKKKSHKGLIIFLIIILLIGGLGYYFYKNIDKFIPEKTLECSYSYDNNTLNVQVTEIRTINFKLDIIESEKIETDYKFNNEDEYTSFKENNEYMKYGNGNSTYKLVDETYTYKTYENITSSFEETSKDYDDVLKSYREKGYSCVNR